MEFIRPACKVSGNNKVLVTECKIISLLSPENKRDFLQLVAFLSLVTSQRSYQHCAVLEPPHLPETLDCHVQIHQVGDGIRFAVIQSLQRLQNTVRSSEERGGESHAYRFRFDSQVCDSDQFCLLVVLFSFSQNNFLILRRSLSPSFSCGSSPHHTRRAQIPCFCLPPSPCSQGWQQSSATEQVRTAR